jgi:hypothetical protein
MAISILLYGTKCWTSTENKKEIEQKRQGCDFDGGGRMENQRITKILFIHNPGGKRN